VTLLTSTKVISVGACKNMHMGSKQ